MSFDAEVNTMASAMQDVARVLHGAHGRGVWPASGSAVWPFPTTDDYGTEARDPETMAALATRIRRPLSSGSEVEDALKLYRLMLYVLEPKMLVAVMCSGLPVSLNKQAQVFGHDRKTLRSHQDRAARRMVNFQLERKKDSQLSPKSGSVLWHAARGSTLREEVQKSEQNIPAA